MPLEEAVNSLDTAKLKPGAKETKITGTREPGIVLEQSPKAEVDVNAGSEVKLTIEAVSVQVPDLKVKTVAQAWIQLSGLNLVPKYREGEEARVSSLLLEVRWQSPEAGVLVAPGTTVIYSAAP
jgi:beta-lactam-binding protein with PASTA domain